MRRMHLWRLEATVTVNEESNAKMKTVLEYVTGHPGCSLREITRFMRFSSLSVTEYWLLKLRGMGYVNWEKYKARTLRHVMGMVRMPR